MFGYRLNTTNKYSYIILCFFMLSQAVFASNNEIKGDSCVILGDDEGDCFLFNPDSFRFDNDVFYSETNDDQNYTYGLSWNWGNDIARHHVLHTETAQYWLFNLFDFNKYRDEFSFQIGLTNFTPDDIGITDPNDIDSFDPNDIGSFDPQFDDRPYASLLYIHSDVFKVAHDGDSSWGVGTTFGVLGTRIGGALQAASHAFTRTLKRQDGPVHPNGWPNQISDGGELTMKVDLSYNARFNPDFFDFDNVDLVWSADTSIGYYTTASLGGTIKIGSINKKISPHNVVKLSSPISAGTKILNLNEPEMFFFAGARKVFVGYNALLECQWKDSPHCLDKNDVESVLNEWSFGAKFYFPRSWKIGGKTSFIISWHGRSAEHKLAKRRSHEWGGITIEWRH